MIFGLKIYGERYLHLTEKACDRPVRISSIPASVELPSLSSSNHILYLLTISTPCEAMVRKAVQKPKPVVAHEAIPSTTLQMGTKESPILLLSDDESEGGERAPRPLGVNAVPQKRYFGMSPSDVYTFRGHGSAYDMMIAMGYKPGHGLGLNLRGSANPRYLPGVSVACLFSSRKCAAIFD